jgi:uncharacterized membrane protein YbjE (DUF340 family)
VEVVIISLLAGCLLGASNLISKAWLVQLDRIVMMTVFILLIAVGLGIGSNQELIANLAVLGWKAMVIAALSTAGSILALWLVASKCDLLQSDKIEEEGL